MTAALQRAWWFIAAPRMLASLMVGMLIAFVAINYTDSAGVTVTGMEEAEGPEFLDPSTLDLVSTVHRTRACPAETQRWVWRWTDYHGERVQQFIPLAGTNLPALASNGTTILTIPAGRVPDATSGEWFYRSVSLEHCGLLPTWIASLFGTHLKRSPDIPVNFVGAPHEP